MNKSRCICLSLATIVSSILLIGCGSSSIETIYKHHEQQDNLATVYLFSPENILDQVNEGNIKDLLVMKDSNFDAPLIEPAKSYSWSQMDFFLVTNALHKSFWGESADEGWKIQSMYFTLDCANVSQGPQRGAFSIYKITSSFWKKSGFEESIVIDFPTNSIWHSNSLLDESGTYSSDLSSLNLTVNDILAIAEESGGENIRKEVENNCNISASISPDGKAKNWSVNYHYKGTNYFTVIIDKDTGEVK
jgi:hypothetical protein